MDFRTCVGAALLLLAILAVGLWPDRPPPPLTACADEERIELRDLPGRGDATLLLCPTDAAEAWRQGGCRGTLPPGKAVEGCSPRDVPRSGRALLVLGRPMDVNLAGAADLEALPGVGPGLARRIVADRQKRGPFSGPRDLSRVRGLGAARIRQLDGWIVAGAAGSR